MLNVHFSRSRSLSSLIKMRNEKCNRLKSPLIVREPNGFGRATKFVTSQYDQFGSEASQRVPTSPDGSIHLAQTFVLVLIYFSFMKHKYEG